MKRFFLYKVENNSGGIYAGIYYGIRGIFRRLMLIKLLNECLLIWSLAGSHYSRSCCVAREQFVSCLFVSICHCFSVRMPLSVCLSVSLFVHVSRGSLTVGESRVAVK